MEVCNQCMKELKDDHLELWIRGSYRKALGDVSMPFKFCSYNCLESFLKEVRSLRKLPTRPQQQKDWR